MAGTHFSGLAVGSGGTELSQIKVFTATINPASIAAATSAEQTFSVPGLTTADKVFVIKPSATAGVGIVNARVSTADTLALTFMNATAGAVDPASESYTIVAFRS